MIILGIDPGTTRIGWAILKTGRKHPVPLDYGCWEPGVLTQGERLLEIFRRMNKVIKQYQPSYLAIEKIFFFHNVKTAMRISEAKGVILLSSQKHHIPYIELTPLEIKQNLTGYGRAEKKDVQKAVQFLFALKEIPKPDDAADALAVALAGISRINND